MSDDHRALIEAARAEHRQVCGVPEHPDECSGGGCAETMCNECVTGDSFCLTARLAEALEQATDRNEEHKFVVLTAIGQRESAQARAARLVAWAWKRGHEFGCPARVYDQGCGVWRDSGEPCSLSCGLAEALGLAAG